MTIFLLLLLIEQTAIMLAVLSMHKIIKTMPITQAQFDADLQALVTAINNLIAAVDALPQPGTFYADLQALVTAINNLISEQRALAVKPTNNSEAYDAYLRGLALVRGSR